MLKHNSWNPARILPGNVHQAQARSKFHFYGLQAILSIATRVLPGNVHQAQARTKVHLHGSEAIPSNPARKRAPGLSEKQLSRPCVEDDPVESRQGLPGNVHQA
jgi:hypothetical protein